MLRAYFDESERDGRIFAVAGFAFVDEQAKKFRKSWKKIFPEGCHMRELAHRQGRFKGLSTDETDTLVVECIKLINRTATFGVGVSCDMQEVASVFPKTLPIFHRVYPMCCYLAMEMLSGIAKAHSYTDGIAYCFESGQQSEGLARIFIQKLVAVPEIGADLLHVSSSFASKKYASGEPVLNQAVRE